MRDHIFIVRIVLLTAVLVTVPPLIGIGLFLNSLADGGGSVPIRFQWLERPAAPWSYLDFATMVQDRFYWTRINFGAWPRGLQFILSSSNPETGEGLEPKNANPTTFEMSLHFVPTQYPDTPFLCFATHDQELWMVDRYGSAYELKGTEIVRRTGGDPHDHPPFSWSLDPQSHVAEFVAGKLTYFAATRRGRHAAFQLVDGAWHHAGEIEFLDTNREWHNSIGQTLFVPDEAVSGNSLSSSSSATFSGHRRVKFLSTVSHQSVFWQTSGRLLFHHGIPLKSASTCCGDTLDEDSEVPHASGLNPTNTVGIDDDWLLVFDRIADDAIWFPAAIGGEPAIVTVEGPQTSHPMARVWQSGAGRWTERFSTALPFASRHFNVGFRDDGSASYLVTRTGLGRVRTLAIEPDGFRITALDHTQQSSKRASASIGAESLIASGLAYSLLSGMILAVTATFLMRRESRLYSFGHRTVTLASVWDRGCARMIDLAFLLIVPVAVFWALTRWFEPDWHIVAEGWNIRNFDDPAFAIVREIVGSCLVAWAVTEVLMIAVQGLFGLTLGKWIYGIRVVRKTLAPCGIAHSLTREIWFCVDCLSLVSWIPGILCITMTQHGQRIGDLVSDTVVIKIPRPDQAIGAS